ncbi:MAG: class I SAM-dependent methyltransferase [Methanosphaera sp.]|nr:class I SAM-dependent methyltransferase [Methanosphaera sp.]
MKYDDIEYIECSEVYPPAEDTFLLIDNLDVEKNDKVLEIGTGTGIISIKASLTAKSVLAVDINPYAIECAKKNIELNGRDNIEVRKSDLFEDIDEKYDIILFNTPYLPVVEEESMDDDYSKAWDGGVDGRNIINPFLEQVAKYLEDNGRIQIVQSSLSDNEKTLEYLNKNGFKAEITANEHQFFEDITLISAKKE